jgi:hypothetical protein
MRRFYCLKRLPFKPSQSITLTLFFFPFSHETLIGFRSTILNELIKFNYCSKRFEFGQVFEEGKYDLVILESFKFEI